MKILLKALRTMLCFVLLIGSFTSSAQAGGTIRAGKDSLLFANKPNLIVDNPNAITWIQYQGDGDDVVEPGETWNVTIRLRNNGTAMAKSVTSTLSITSGNAIIRVGSSLYPNIPVGGTAINTTQFQIKVMNTQPCDSSLGLRFVARYKKGNNTLTHNFTQAVGPAPLPCTVYNTAPTANNDAYFTTVSTILDVPAPGVLANDMDAEADPMTAVLVSGPSQGTLIFRANGSFTYTPVTGYTGEVTFSYKTNDGLLDSNVAIVTITMTSNQPPVLATIPNQTTDELVLLTFTASATDPEAPPEILTYSLGPSSPSGAGINPTSGVFTWTPAEMQGPGVYTATVIVTDNGAPNRMDTQDVRITVNEVNTAPVVDPIPPLTIDEQTTLVYTVTVTDSDYPPNGYDFSLDPGAPAGASIDIDTGVFTWTPTESQGPGNYSITVRVTDYGTPSLDGTRTFQVTVREVNKAPVLNTINNQMVDESALLTFTASATDADIPVNTLTYSLVSGAPTGASIDPASGIFTWTPVETQGPGIYTIGVKVTDNGSPAMLDIKTFQVTVNEVNTAPVLDPIGYHLINGMNTLVFTATATDSDLPLNALAFSLDAGAPAGASINPTTGAFTWTPSVDQVPGDYYPTVRVTDNGNPALSDFEVVHIQVVAEPNVPPELDPIGSQLVDEQALLTFTAVAHDSNIPVNLLTFSLDTGAPTGASIDAQSGVFTWTPTEAQGPDVYTITVRVTDNGTPNMSDSENVQVTVAEVNQAPELETIGNKTVDELVLLTFTAHAMDNDLPPNTLTYSLDSGAPSGATIDPTSGVFTWTPTEAQGFGNYNITVRATDDGSPFLSDFETIQVTVNEVNQAPVLGTIGNKTVDELVLLTFTAHATDNDLPPNTLTYSLDSGAPSGATIDPTSGVFTWTPTEAQGFGNYNITVRATDDGNPVLSDFETIQVTVNEVNLPPVVNAGPDQVVVEGQLVSFHGSYTDPGLTAFINSQVAADSIQWNFGDGATAAGTLDPTHTYVDNGIYTVILKVTDSLGASSQDSLLVTVNNVNPLLPLLPDLNYRIGYTTWLTTTFSDPGLLDTHTVTIEWETGQVKTLNLPAGVLAFSSSHLYANAGVYNVTVTVTDKDGGQCVRTFRVTVELYKSFLPVTIR